MIADDFRRLALTLPEAVERQHMGHPDFRVGGKIFATLVDPTKGRAMVKLTVDQREALVGALPTVFSPVPGGWGRTGAAYVDLTTGDPVAVHDALVMAWCNTAPRSLVARHPELAPEP